jgi:cellulose biosynthesis protein BcsQ
MQDFPYILTISSEKGGVGKTTLATNLAVYLKAMRDDLPVTILSFDNHFTIDRMFELKGQKIRGTVHDFLMGEPFKELIHTGQYGVGYLPSSTELGDIHERFTGPMSLARMFANADYGGIVIIDTRPDLNILTQNALYAADRVLIPVKDMPSLENCKNIFALFDQRGIDKKSLSLIPCLIDERIKFDGVFKDQKTLLRAFAINRGYRCMDTYISKSPKVESLNTNPDGKIYPVLTHARGTDVHCQFSEISREILQQYDAASEPRSYLYAAWLREKEQKKKETYLARLEGLAQRCLICGAPLADQPRTVGFYYETSDRASRGFLHSDCFNDLLCATLYGMTSRFQAYGAARLVVAGRTAQSVSVFAPQTDGNEAILDFRQFDLSGNELFRKTLPMPGFAEGRLDGVNDRLFLLLNESMAGFGGELRSGCWLKVYPVDETNPEGVLLEERYSTIRQLHRSIAERLAEG